MNNGEAAWKADTRSEEVTSEVRCPVRASKAEPQAKPELLRDWVGNLLAGIERARKVEGIDRGHVSPSRSSALPSPPY